MGNPDPAVMLLPLRWLGTLELASLELRAEVGPEEVSMGVISLEMLVKPRAPA